ncbi:hypothetical protein [Clostridium botulinum]|uniref:hypothetical protein n=1 Tax=Clostridium botulinum TaxID=1491 RepID=UPI000774BA69|nr:hypothetical protein [Clostridium botulinum]
MAKILNSDYISGEIQRVVETPLGYIINGIYYDKKTMTPKPLQTFPSYGYRLYLGMDKNLLLNGGYSNHYKTMGDTIINDRYDPTISYIFTTHYNNSTKTIFKIREYNGKVDILKYFNFGNLSGGNYQIINSYVGQDRNYIYVLFSGSTSGNGYNDFLYKIDKETLASTSIDNMTSNSWSTPIKETEEYIYYGQTNDRGSHYIKRYNKITNRIEGLPLPTMNDQKSYSVSYSNLLSNSNLDFYMFSVFQDSESHKMQIVRYYFDMTKNDIKDICTIKTYKTGDKEQLITQPINVNSMNIHYEPFITNMDNKSYLNIAIYEKVGSTSNNISYYGIYTFQIDKTTKDITYKSFLNIKDYFRGFIGVRNNTFLAGASNEKCYFLNFEKDKFVITNVLNNSPQYIGADLAENIWIVNKLGEVEMYSPFVPIHVNIEYEFENYNYEGKDIDTYISIESKNYLNENIASKLKLTIKGEAVFSNNSDNIIIDNTLETGKKRIPITIKGDGAITIDAEMAP